MQFKTAVSEQKSVYGVKRKTYILGQSNFKIFLLVSCGLSFLVFCSALTYFNKLFTIDKHACFMASMHEHLEWSENQRSN